ATVSAAAIPAASRAPRGRPCGRRPRTAGRGPSSPTIPNGWSTCPGTRAAWSGSRPRPITSGGSPASVLEGRLARRQTELVEERPEARGGQPAQRARAPKEVLRVSDGEHR